MSQKIKIVVLWVNLTWQRMVKKIDYLAYKSLARIFIIQIHDGHSKALQQCVSGAKTGVPLINYPQAVTSLTHHL